MPGELRQRFARVTDLGRAGKEDEHVAARPRHGQLAHRGRDLIPEAARVRAFGVLDGNLESAPLAPHRPASEVRRDRCSVERRRHDHQLQIRPRPAQKLQHERQRDVALQVPLVELVEHHGGDAAQQRIGQESPRQHTLGDESQAGAGAGDVLEPHLVAGRLPGSFAQFLRDPPGSGARGQPARLEHHHLPRDQVEQGGRYARRLACSRGSLQHQGGPLAQASRDLRQDFVDGQRFAHQAPHCMRKAR